MLTGAIRCAGTHGSNPTPLTPGKAELQNLGYGYGYRIYHSVWN